ncbi:peptidyl-prolyl cis-trans isomerase NIMA-interacting 4 [Pelomyxa schiedti]|nr:peptidyl-prolyl cis-trans isomerase NIMA-interacting 4 [Pelomyxa schiedti]
MPKAKAYAAAPKPKSAASKSTSGKGKSAAATTTASSSADKVKPANHCKCRHVLCEKQGKIMEAYAKLQEGMAFATVASTYSEDKARDGGNLGWLARGSMVGPFQDRAFAQPIGKYTEPFKTTHGWHILLVEDRKM